MQLLPPSLELLPSYIAALRLGWASGAEADRDAAAKLLARIEADPAVYLKSIWNPEGHGPKVTLSDGRQVPRLAHVRYWIVDEEYFGDLNLRWQPGTNELPSYCDGHVGYAVVPWKRGLGVASAALRSVLSIAPKFGLRWLDIAMSAENMPSRRVAESSGAVLVEEYIAVEQGGVRACRYRVQCREA